jgi:hypothetical protein
MKQNNEKILKNFNFTASYLPKFVEVVKNKDWVFFGEDNLAPQHLIELYNYSALNRTCLTAKRDGVIGRGLYTENPEDENRLLMANSTETVYEVFKKAALDYVLFGGFSLNIIWKQDRSLGIAEIYHLDFSRLRCGKTDDFDVVNEYFYSSDWTNLRKYPARKLAKFNIDEEEPSQVYYYKGYTPDQNYYPNPDYLGATRSIEIDVEVKNYHLKNAQQNYYPGLFVSLNNGVPSEEERDSIYKHLEATYSGTDNAGRLFLSFSDGKENEPTITPIGNNGSDGMFLQLNEIIQNSILTGHRISSPLLLGIQRPGALGGRQEIIDSAEHFLNTVIIPAQETLLGVFEKLLFIRDKKPIDLKIEQNKIIEEIE